ncbi:hypothetical protein ZEAMMB73_Zm00001d019227 [Zea mays]|uniref:Uncharacterized protein n=1 Tax=Zea mays TaxID=4577 RepID=A0A1D6HWA5_MAIZE|nr:hypothetical protein ZEAMMB73_Zm00001d019227 [Zea mays]
MVGAIGTLVVDTVATGYFTRVHFKDSAAAAVGAAAVGDEEQQQQQAASAPHVDDGADGDGHGHGGHAHMHTHATHGHSHGASVIIKNPMVQSRGKLQLAINAFMLFCAGRMATLAKWT